MEHRLLGHAGFRVPRVSLGCGNVGGIGSSPAFFGRGLTEDEAFRLLDASWELGLTWVDTADAYGGGRSETAIGRWIAATGRRPLITTKTYNPMAEGADRGLSRARVLRRLDSSLGRLGVERVDLYYAHEHDREIALDETLGVFDEVVRAGKARAWGVSNWSAAQLAEAIERCAARGLARPEAVQNSYSLLDRSDEAELLPLCAEHGIAYTVFSPLAGGWLTGKYRRGEAFPEGSRMTMRPEPYAHLLDDRVFDGLDGLAAAASARGVSTAALALAWVLGHPDVTAIVSGPMRPEHLEPVTAALGIELTPGERERIGSLFER